VAVVICGSDNGVAVFGVKFEFLVAGLELEIGGAGCI